MAALAEEAEALAAAEAREGGDITKIFQEEVVVRYGWYEHHWTFLDKVYKLFVVIRIMEVFIWYG